MQEGPLLMTQADRDRLVTLKKAKKKLITQRESSGRLFLDRVARQHCPSPLHRHEQNNMRSPGGRGNGDISTLPAWGHFYFALTSFRICLTRPHPCDSIPPMRLLVAVAIFLPVCALSQDAPKDAPKKGPAMPEPKN